MSYYKNGICDYCNITGKLVLTLACADSDVGYCRCCEKYVCEINCDWNCSLCFTKVTVNNIKYVFFFTICFSKTL
jgi:hypothetical protein